MTIIQKDFATNWHILFDDSCISSPSKDTFSAQYWQERNAVVGQAKGRGTTIFIENEGQNWVLRHFRRGGLIGKWLNDQYVFIGAARSRPFEELQLLSTMREKGLNVPKPIAACIYRSGLVYRGDLITQMIPQSVDLHHILTRRALSQNDWNSVGKALRAMHDCQVYHHDANIRNIMIDNDNNVWLIDFDRCHQRSGNHWKQSNLKRLLRSLRKEQAKNVTFHWSESDWADCLAGYHTHRASA